MEKTLEQRQCGRKRILVSYDEARREAKFLHKKFKSKFFPYECQWCGGFHVGRISSPAGGAAWRAWRAKPLSGRRLREALRAGKDLAALDALDEGGCA
jgi:hypothetical protein